MNVLGLFRSGDLVKESGTYAVLHSTPHSLIQHATHIEGTRFHECKLCPMGVWYRLEAPYTRAYDAVPRRAQAAWSAA
jgi:hypothetical protein